MTQPVALAGVGVILGLLRLLSAAGILTNRLWGWVLGLLVSLVTFSMLTFYLPAGMSDAVLSGLALVGQVLARFGNQKISG